MPYCPPAPALPRSVSVVFTLCLFAYCLFMGVQNAILTVDSRVLFSTIRLSNQFSVCLCFCGVLRVSILIVPAYQEEEGGILNRAHCSIEMK